MTRLFIDVREPHEFARGTVPGSINLPPAVLLQGAEVLSKIPKDTELVLFCLTGNRSNASMHYLREIGFTNLINGINKNHVLSKYNF